jgi:hypothetical protein
MFKMYIQSKRSFFCCQDRKWIHFNKVPSKKFLLCSRCIIVFTLKEFSVVKVENGRHFVKMNTPWHSHQKRDREGEIYVSPRQSKKMAHSFFGKNKAWVDSPHCTVYLFYSGSTCWIWESGGRVEENGLQRCLKGCLKGLNVTRKRPNLA